MWVEQMPALQMPTKKHKGYNFTPAQLEEHDRVVITAYVDRMKEKIRNDVKAELNYNLDEEFRKRSEIFRGTTDEVEARVFSLMSATVIRILVRDFHWTPIRMTGKNSERTKLAKFLIKLQEEFDLIGREDKDIRDYWQIVYAETGAILKPEGEELPTRDY